MKRKRLLILSIVFILAIASTVILLNMSKNKESIQPVTGTISAGHDHTLALKNDGTVVAAGSNEYGQCDVEGWTDIVQVSAGQYYSLGLKKDGTVVAAGCNKSGECEVSDWKDVIYISAGLYYAVGLKNDGTIVSTYASFGDNQNDAYSDIKYVDAASSSVNLINDEGVIINTISDKYTIDRTSKFLAKFNNPFSVQSTFVLDSVLLDSGQLILNNKREIISLGKKKYNDIVQFDVDNMWLCMLNNYGEAKIVKYYGNFSFVEILKNELEEWGKVISVEAGTDFAIGLKEDGTVVAAGDNEHGQCNVEEWTDIATEPLPMDIDNDNK